MIKKKNPRYRHSRFQANYRNYIRSNNQKITDLPILSKQLANWSKKILFQIVLHVLLGISIILVVIVNNSM